MNNEDKIIALLEKQGVALEKQGELLAKHDVMLEHINETLAEHSEMLENLTTRVTKIELTQENVILPGLQALAEGQETLRQTLCSRERAERLETDVDLLKTAVRGLFRDVQELKRAQ